MRLAEYYGFPEGTKAHMRYANFYDTVINCVDIYLQNMSYVYAFEKGRYAVKMASTSNATNMSYMFKNCSSLISVPQFDTSNVTDMDNMFTDCSSLTSVPQFDTSNVTIMRAMFGGCSSLTTIPPMDCSKISSGSNYPIYSSSDMSKLTDVGGFLNMKYSWTDTYGIRKCPNLTYESCINILNGLYDFTGNGKTPTSKEGKLKVHANFLTAVGDEISIGTNKGWTITT